MKHIYKIKQFFLCFSFLALLFLLGCSSTGCAKKQVPKETIHILSGSENKELEPILDAFEKDTGVTIEITYKGSVDIMYTLKNGATRYDAVWPASSIWISLGDNTHCVKHSQSISLTPVVFGIKRPLAEQYGLTGRNNVSIKELLPLIQNDRLKFCMASATQSNSGASAYIGFLYALLDKQEALTEADLDDKQLRESISDLLQGVERSSGSSDWLKEMFLKGDYDAMVNYESLMIDANQTLVAQGKEPLYILYPYDGLSLSDSPLGYIDHKNEKKEQAFLALQDYLLSDEVQKQIEKTGRRIQTSGVSKENQEIFCEDWGIDTNAILSPINMPSEKVLQKALQLYQSDFRKPSLNVYCLDYSGSMKGEGHTQLVEAMRQILIQENAEKNMLQAAQGEVNIIITFHKSIKHIYVADSASPEDMEDLFLQMEQEKVGGKTNMYVAIQEALNQIKSTYDVNDYTPAIILLTDGKSKTSTKQDFMDMYQSLGLDIPVFSIMFGEADADQLNDLAEFTNAKVFDGRENLIQAFQTVKGYN